MSPSLPQVSAPWLWPHSGAGSSESVVAAAVKIGLPQVPPCGVGIRDSNQKLSGLLVSAFTVLRGL